MRISSLRCPRRGSLRRRLWLAALLLSGLAAQAQVSPQCATPHEADLVSRHGGLPTLPLTGEVRALLVFVRFADDARPGDGCAEGGVAWPPDAARPTFADELLSPTPGGAAPDGSLTTLYRLASSGRFDLYGSAFGHVTQHPESHYFLPGDANLNREALAREILGALRDQGVALASYDANGDGTLDQLIVVLRSFSRDRGLFNCQVANGIARCADGIATLYNGPSIPASEFGITVHAMTSGQFSVYQSVRPYADLVGLIAHETGHQLWTYHGLTDVHLAPITENGVPANDDHARALALMIGDGPRTDFPTAAERDILSEALPPSDRWLTCAAPEPGRTYELGDTFSTNDCLRFEYGPACPGCVPSRVLVSGVYRETPFAQASTPFSTVSSQCPGCVQVEAGLPATGVMLEAVNHSPVGTARRDLIPSDNRLDSFDGCALLTNVAPTATQVFGADFWTAGAQAIHPFSSPNIYGYASLLVTPRSVYDTAGPPHELSGFRTGPAGRVAFDYRTDLLERDSLVAAGDWSFGSQFGPLSFASFRMGAPGLFALADGTRLTVGRLDLRLARQIVLGADVQVAAAQMLLPPPGARISVEVGARSALVIPHRIAGTAVRMREDALLHVQGDLEVHGVLELEPGSHLVVDGDLDLRSPTAQALIRGTIRVQGRLITPAGAARQLQVEGELEVGGAWHVGGGHVTLSVGQPRRLPAIVRLRGGVSVPDAARVSLLLAEGAEADIAGLLPVRAGASLLMDRATLTSHGGVRLERGSTTTLFGGGLRFGPNARLEVGGHFLADTGTGERPTRMEALDPDAGWGGVAFQSGGAPNLFARNLELSGVAGQPALLVEHQTLVLSSVRIQSPRAEGAIVVRGGQVSLFHHVEAGPTAGVGLDVSGGATVTLAPPVSLVGHRVALRVDSSVVRSSCTAASACPGEPTSILPDRSLPGAAEVELWNGATVRLPYAQWWTNRPDLLLVGGDGTGTLEVTPMGAMRAGGEPTAGPEVGTVTPNPARSAMAVPVSLAGDATVQVVVHDVLGRRVATQTLQMERGHHRVPLPLGFVPAGTYLHTVTVTQPDHEPTRDVQPFTVVR